MSRTVNATRRLSITDRIANAQTIEQIAQLREVLQDLFREGKLAPSAKTVRTWHEMMWTRVLQLMLAAEADEDACYVYNVSLTWPKPPGLQEQMYAFLHAFVATRPNHVERLSRRGIIVEGVSTAAQRDIAEKIRRGWVAVHFRADGQADYEFAGVADPQQFADGGTVPPHVPGIVGEPPAPGIVSHCDEMLRHAEAACGIPAPIRIDLTEAPAGSPANTQQNQCHD